ncbi:MAG: ubiquinol-cytochrome c reductase iron-sulfur subunit [Candidatus Kapaibacteriota bacterium]
MERKEFLKNLGLGFAGLAIAKCVIGCGDNNTTSPTNIDFTIDLNDPRYSSLRKVGGFVIVNDVLIAKTSENTYIAVSAICTHEGKKITFRANNNDFFCPSHDSVFSLEGKRLAGPAKKDLTKFKVELNGNILRVYS